MKFRSFVSPLAAALALAVFAVPTMASAEEAPAGEQAQQIAKKGERKGKRARLEFPMQADKFSTIVDQRIAKAQAKVQRVLAKRNVAPEIRKAVLADLQRGADQVQAAADKAESDGTVTKEEAKQVRQIARQVRKAAKEKYGDKLGRKGHKKGKGDKKGKGQKRGNRDNGPANGPRGNR